MAYHVHHRFGKCESNPPLGRLEELYEQLSISDDEHPDVSVEHESAWSLAAFQGGLLVWENVESDGEARHMKSVPREKVIELWQKLAAGDVESIDAEAWLPGYGS